MINRFWIMHFDVFLRASGMAKLQIHVMTQKTTGDEHYMVHI